MKANSNAESVGALNYKNRPFVRCGNTICYGSPSDSHVVTFKIQSTARQKDLDIPTKILVRLISTDLSVKSKSRVVKEATKESFSEAMDIALAWLEGLNREN